MIIRLVSELFSFSRAKVSLLPEEWTHLPPAGTLQIGNCVDDMIELDIQEDGVYNLWLSEITIRGKSSGRELSVVGFVLPLKLIVNKENRGGRTELSVRQDSILRITTVDERDTRLSNQDVTFFGDFVSSTFRSDQNGDIIILEDPTRYPMTGPENVRLKIERLDI